MSEQIGLEPNDVDAEKTWEERHPEKQVEKSEPDSLIISLSEGLEEMSAGDIAKRVNEELKRDDINPQKVAAVLREHKKTATV